MLMASFFMLYYIYILRSQSADKYYVGYTDNVERRLTEHNTSPRTTFTSKYRPWIICCCFEISPSRAEDMRAEKYIKRQKSRVFLKKLIENETERNRIAQLVRVPIHRD